MKNETQRRQLSIAKELVTWGVAIPNLLSRLAVASRKPAFSGRLKLEFEIMARRINTKFNAIGETPDADTANAALYDQLIENTDRLRELIGTANVALNLMPEV
jgi:hypothetical protein